MFNRHPKHEIPDSPRDIQDLREAVVRAGMRAAEAEPMPPASWRSTPI